MKFLKKIGKALFSSKKKTKTQKKSPKRRAVKSSQKKISKKAVKLAKKKTGKKVSSKKQPGMVKKALKALPIAEVTHYFPHVNAAVLRIKIGDIRIGDELHFKGHTTDFKEKVVSMQIDHKPVMIAKKGDDFGVQVKSRVRAGDLVFKK